MNTTTYEKQWRLSMIGFRIVKLESGPPALFAIHFKDPHNNILSAGTDRDLPALVDRVWEAWWAKLWRYDVRILTAPSHVEYEHMLDHAHRAAARRLTMSRDYQGRLEIELRPEQP